jgi:hypothetical protein
MAGKQQNLPFLGQLLQQPHSLLRSVIVKAVQRSVKQDKAWLALRRLR